MITNKNGEKKVKDGEDIVDGGNLSNEIIHKIRNDFTEMIEQAPKKLDR